MTVTPGRALAADRLFAARYAANDLFNGIPMQGSAAATPGWWRDTACSQTDLDAFFPEDAEIGDYVKNICRRCPVRAQCLDDAMVRDDNDYGYRAALSPHARRDLRRVLYHQARKAAAA